LTVIHLAKRFVGSLAPGGPKPDDAAWVEGLLSEAELALWRRMSGPDQRHAAGVARSLGDQPTNVLVAALLHDVGKVESGIRTLGRVAATLLRPWQPAAYKAYYDHPRIGAELLELAHSDPLVITWAREHHLPPERWTLPIDVAAALKAADDD
jgi:putative nucleotidyltransferase with HDIG domain